MRRFLSGFRTSALLMILSLAVLATWVRDALVANRAPAVIVDDPRYEAGVLPPEVVRAFGIVDFWEYGMRDDQRAPDRALIQYVRAGNWRWMAAHLVALRKQTKQTNPEFLLQAACQWLPPQEYADFLEIWVQLYEKHAIPENLLYEAVGGYRGKGYFVDVNSDDPQIRRILKRLVVILPEDQANPRTGWQETLDGKASDGWWGEQMSDPNHYFGLYPERMAWSLPAFPFKHALKPVLTWALMLATGPVVWWQWRQRNLKRWGH
jgi:hypothetical protein